MSPQIILPSLPEKVVAPPAVDVVPLTVETTHKLNQEVLAGTKEPYLYIGITDTDYLNSAKWQQDILRYIRQLRAQLESVREQLEEHNERVNKLNAEGVGE